MLFFTLGFINITFGNVFTFLLGIAMGMAIVTLVYMLYILKGLNSASFRELSRITIEDVSITSDMKKKDIKKLLNKHESETNAYKSSQMVLKYLDIFKDKRLKGKSGNLQYTLNLSKSLVYNIAALYNPKSDYPVYAITIDEFLDLAKYLSRKINEILDYNGLKMFRKLEVNTIVSVKDFSFEITESKLVKGVKRFHINKVLFGLKILTNFVNPIYWVRKLVINTSMDVISDKICIAIIQVVGEEAYNIYSKSYLRRENDLIEE